MKKILLNVISMLAGVGIGVATIGKVKNEEIMEKQKLAEKHFALFQLMNQWVKVKQEGKSIAHYLKDKGYNRIAIYGMSYVGETLCLELRESDIEIAYGIDKNAENVYAQIEVVSMESDLELVDAIIVTPITFYQEIKKELVNKINCPILSVEDILYEL